MHELQNEFLSIKVNPVGAELSSLKNLETGIEHLWQGNPEFWASQAPNLFPVIGVLKEGNKLVFQLECSAETLEIYPFKFRFEISFQLNKKSLTVHHHIFNLDDKPLYFSLGGHPAFNAPINENEVYEDYHLEFDRKMDLRTYILNEDGLVSDTTEGILDNEDKIRLHKELFAKDALIFKNIPSKKVVLKSKNSGSILSVEYKDFKNLGIWAKPGAPYVCIEPWLGIADVEGTDQNLKTKEGIETLAAGKDFQAAYTIDIT